LLISYAAPVQYQAWPLKDTIHVDKMFDSSELAKLRSYYSSINSTYLGQFYIPFAINTFDSNYLNNNSCRGKVILFVFWQVTA